MNGIVGFVPEISSEGIFENVMFKKSSLVSSAKVEAAGVVCGRNDGIIRNCKISGDLGIVKK